MRLPRVRFRLSTLILLVVICAQVSLMVIHQGEGNWCQFDFRSLK
jgi:hypothetical protein